MCAAIVLARGGQPPTAQASAAATAAVIQPSPAEDTSPLGVEWTTAQDRRPSCRPQQQSPAGEEDGGLAHEDAVGEGQGREALRLLDMAALMGGPLLRPAVDAAIQRLQTRLQQGVLPQLPSLDQNCSFPGLTHLQSCPRPQSTPADVPPEAVGRAPPTDHRLEVVSVPWELGRDTAKRRKVWGASAETDAVDEAPTQHRWSAAPELRERVPLPPGSLKGAAVPTERLPSLEGCVLSESPELASRGA